MPTLPALRQALTRPVTPLDMPDASEAAVAAVFTANLDLLFIERAKHPGDPWSGHISFPGGKREPEDPDLLGTAQRETWEELGLDLSGAELLGGLDEITTVAGLPNMIVRPYVFLMEELPALKPNPEVAQVHLRSLRSLLDDHGRGRFSFDFKGHPVTLPKIDFAPGDTFLWGMTLRMVDQLLDRIDGRGIGLARIR